MRIICAGFVAADIVVRRARKDGATLGAPRYAAGGTAGNIACLMAFHQWKTFLCATVGADELGGAVATEFRAADVDTAAVNVSEEPTRRLVHSIVAGGPEAGVHYFDSECYACRREFAAVAPPPYDVASARLGRMTEETVLIVDRANATTVALCQDVAGAGGVVVYEPAYLSRNVRHVEQILETVSIIKLSGEYERSFSGLVTPEKCPRAIIYIVTDGGRGVRLGVWRGKSAGTGLALPAFPLPAVVDAGGAGDALTAGFLNGLGRPRLRALDGVPVSEIESAMMRGQALGALSCLFAGSRGLMRCHTLQDVRAAVEATLHNAGTPAGFGMAQCEESAGTALASPGDGRCPVCRL